MTIDELKIQVEAGQDLIYLQKGLRKYLEENSNNNNLEINAEQQEKFLEEIFAIVMDNVQIDGIDPDKVGEQNGIEQVDVQLETKLEELQVETDKLLVEIAAIRRTCPEEVRKKFISELEEFERAKPTVMSKETLDESSMITLSDMDELAVGKLLGTLERLKGLNQSVPELVAKLQRAQTVLIDSSKHSNPLFHGKGNNGSITSMTNNNTISSNENPSELLNRQRRINRQRELAAKLIALQ